MKSGLCRRVFIQLSYAIGVPYPLSDFFVAYRIVAKGRTDVEFTEVVNKNSGLRPPIHHSEFEPLPTRIAKQLSMVTSDKTMLIHLATSQGTQLKMCRKLFHVRIS